MKRIVFSDTRHLDEHELLDNRRKNPIEAMASQVPAALGTVGALQTPARIVALPVTLRGHRLTFVQVDDTELANPETLPH